MDTDKQYDCNVAILRRAADFLRLMHHPTFIRGIGSRNLGVHYLSFTEVAVKSGESLLAMVKHCRQWSFYLSVQPSFQDAQKGLCEHDPLMHHNVSISEKFLLLSKQLETRPRI